MATDSTATFDRIELWTALPPRSLYALRFHGFVLIQVQEKTKLSFGFACNNRSQGPISTVALKRKWRWWKWKWSLSLSSRVGSVYSVLCVRRTQACRVSKEIEHYKHTGEGGT